MSTVSAPLPGRLLSLDAYRGFIMLAMASAGLGTAKLMGDPNWGWLAHQLEHLKWEGCTFWDLIQPSFMFMVGVSMPFAFAKRVERGESWGRQFTHVIKRCLLLCFIGLVLDSYGKDHVHIQFIRVLQQIAIGYLIAFLVLHLGPVGQVTAVVVLLGGHSLAFWLDGGDQAWSYDNRDNNIGRQIDRALHYPFEQMGFRDIIPLSPNFYVTFNAISSAGTILIGVLVGGLLKSSLSNGLKALVLVLAGAALYFAGLGLGHWMPLVKKIWTASFALYAAGWTCWMMAFFFLMIDVIGWRGWAFPFTVVGVNSIFIYCVSQTMKNPIRSLLAPIASCPLRSFGPWEPVVMAILVITVEWLLCLFLYRHRIFFKV